MLADDPALTVRRTDGAGEGGAASAAGELARQPRRVVLDSLARTPLTSRLVSDEHAHQTIVVSTRAAAKSRLLALQKRVTVMVPRYAEATLISVGCSSGSVSWT